MGCLLVSLHQVRRVRGMGIWAYLYHRAVDFAHAEIAAAPAAARSCDTEVAL